MELYRSLTCHHRHFRLSSYLYTRLFILPRPNHRFPYTPSLPFPTTFPKHHLCKFIRTNALTTSPLRKLRPKDLIPHVSPPLSLIKTHQGYVYREALLTFLKPAIPLKSSNDHSPEKSSFYTLCSGLSHICFCSIS